MKIQTVEDQINLVIDSAVKLDSNRIIRIRIALMCVEKTIIIKSFYLAFPIIK